MSLFALIGAVDNLDEKTPLINRRTTIFGLVITSLVIASHPTHITGNDTDASFRLSPHFVSPCGYMSDFS